jgi:hypothetical protein
MRKKRLLDRLSDIPMRKTALFLHNRGYPEKSIREITGMSARELIRIYALAGINEENCRVSVFGSRSARSCVRCATKACVCEADDKIVS